jgi:hypothetical protein
MHNNKVIEAWHSILFLASCARCYCALVMDEFTGDIQRDTLCFLLFFFADEVVIIHERWALGVSR